MTRVSVIIPTFNRERYISRSVGSVLSQTYRDFEVIVVDDGSSDNTRQVVAACGAGVRYVLQDNAGPGAARNHGIRVSRGEYLAFLDSDDVWTPTFLSKTVSALEAHPDVGVVTTSIHIGPADRTKEACMEGVETGVWELPPCFTKEGLPFVLNGFCAGAVLARKEIVNKYGGYYEHRCTLGEDVYLWLQVLLNCKTYRLREPLVWYDTDASSLGFSSKRTRYPLEPVLTDTEPIWQHCPNRYREFLSYWLACHALKSVHIQIATGDYENARWLLEHYPLVREWKWDWQRIQFKLAFPHMTKCLRKIKSMIRAAHNGTTRDSARSQGQWAEVAPGLLPGVAEGCVHLEKCK